MYGKLPALIEEVSGEGDTVKPDFVPRVKQLDVLWQLCQADGSTVVSTAVARAIESATPALKSEMMRLLKAPVEAMASASRTAFTSHIAPMLALLQRREFYMPSSCSHSIDQLREVHKKEFVGAENFEFGVIAQARQYVETMVRMRECDGDDKLKSIKTYWFWVRCTHCSSSLLRV